jgi:riboflavin kinase / FMN adenylyltransferase
MKAQPSSLSAKTRSLVVIGNFDGVHLGHQAVLSEALKEARAQQLVPRLLTFDPHPRVVVSGQKPELLTTMSDRLRLLREQFSEIEVWVEPFTRELSQLEPREFARLILEEKLGASLVLVGQDFRFGRGRSGDLAKLIELGKEGGFEARAIGLVCEQNGEAYSSSRIRELVKQGDVEGARRMLGRPYSLTAEVTRGDGRGRTLGFPTANLSDSSQLAPGFGVYAVRVTLSDGRLFLGVMNHGPRPTVDRPVATEVHLLDFAEDIYGQELRVELLTRLREVHRFESREALVQQIARDIAGARALPLSLLPR